MGEKKVKLTISAGRIPKYSRGGAAAHLTFKLKQHTQESYAKGPIEIGPLFTNLMWFCNPQRKHLVYQTQ